MIHIALLESEIPGNIGAVARIMNNLGVSKLILINPQCDHLASEATARATKHAKHILKKVKVVKRFNYLKKFDYIIGTTAIQGSDYNIPRVAISPEKLSDKIKNIKNNIIIVFGREGNGLRNEEIKQCDVMVTIPTSPKNPTMNISHSVGILLYEIFKTKHQNEIELASKKEKDVLLKEINKIINKFKFSTKEKKETQKIIWKKVLNKSFLTKREIFSLFGFFRKLK
jgi:TrmH family RNA methyltransferase